MDAGDVPENLPEAYPLQDDQLDGQRRMRRLEEAILSLPPRCREVFILLRIEELPAEEVARRLRHFPQHGPEALTSRAPTLP